MRIESELEIIYLIEYNFIEVGNEGMFFAVKIFTLLQEAFLAVQTRTPIEEPKSQSKIQIQTDSGLPLP